jgi:hypothetical protein
VSGVSKLLTERYRITTSGARGVTPFTIAREHFLAIPQLSQDSPGTPPGMNGGDSDTDLLIMHGGPGGYTEYQRIAAPGGEDAEFFTIDEQVFLAVASIRHGRGPYEYATDSVVHRWDGEKFAPFQTIPTYAAKQWKHFAIGQRHFLALAQGVSVHPERNRPSTIFEWTGAGFVPFQEIVSQWAYNWHFFPLDGHFFLAHADHIEPSVLYRWDGTRFIEYEKLLDKGGRAFATFEAGSETYLACAVIEGDSRLYRWDGHHFTLHQVLEGAGAREFAVITGRTSLYLVRVNFIRGSRQDPVTQLQSQIYQWDGERLIDVDHFPTTGGTDVAVFGDEPLVAVSNSLTPDVRFSADTLVYTFKG